MLYLKINFDMLVSKEIRSLITVTLLSLIKETYSVEKEL